MLDAIQTIGARVLDSLAALGRAFMHLFQTLLAIGEPVRKFSLLNQQLFASGVKTLSIILVSGLFVGMVLALQGYNTLVRFGAEESLGVVAVSYTHLTLPTKRIV